MAIFICPNCGKQLNEYVRFCPECGTRIPEQPAAAPPAGVAPTVVLPPIPSAQIEPTIFVPPDSATPTPPQASVSPTRPLEELPPVPPTAMPTPPPAAFPPAQPAIGQPEPAAKGRSRGFWWIATGAGCLVMLLALGCIGFFGMNLLGQGITNFEFPSQATPTRPAGAGGGIVPSDAPIVGGDVLLRESFDNADASNFDAAEDDVSRYSFADGTYVIEVKGSEQLVWSIAGGPYSDLQVEVDSTIASDADPAAAGLIFHYQDTDNFYLFSVDNDGYYALEILEDNSWVTLIDWTQSDAIDRERNTLRVETKGDEITLFVNGTRLESTNDAAFTSGDVGIAVTSFADSSATVAFDNLVIARNR